MFIVRKWSRRQAGFLESLYLNFERFFLLFRALFEVVGYKRMETPMAFVEQKVKGLLFDCQMCGKCVLSSTGMTCPMNCPKELRNGPCGGVRDNGNCEVKPEMPCVWVEAFKGSQSMITGERIRELQYPVDHSLIGSSSWLAIMRGEHEPLNNPAYVHRYSRDWSNRNLALEQAMILSPNKRRKRRTIKR